MGSSRVRHEIIYGKSEADIRVSRQKDLAAYKELRNKYLLYPDDRR